MIFSILIYPLIGAGLYTFFSLDSDDTPTNERIGNIGKFMLLWPLIIFQIIR